MVFRLMSGASVCFVCKSAFLAPVEGSAPEKRMLMSHNSDSSCFRWALLVELAWWCCPFSSESLSEAVLDLLFICQKPHYHKFSWCPGDLLSVHTPILACTCVHPGTVHWQNNGSNPSPNPDARGSRREIWGWLICYHHLTRGCTLPFNE